MNLELIDAFAFAALDPSGWVPALNRLADVTGSSRSELIGIGRDGSRRFYFATEIDDRALADFARIKGYDPAINYRVAVGMAATPMTVAAESDYAMVIPQLDDDSYIDFCRDHQHSFGCQTNLLMDRDGLVGLSIVRADSDGATTAAQREIFRSIAPHVRSAVRINQALGDKAVMMITDALDHIDAAAFLIDASRKVVGMTAAADRMLSRGRLRLRAGGLSSQVRDETDALNLALHRAVTPPRVLGATTVVFREPDLRAQIVLDVVALPARMAIPGREARALVIVRERRSHRASTVALLRSAFGLSDSEAEIAAALGDGSSREAIAATRGVSINTVRSQIKTIFAKLSLNRESELIAWINSLG